MAIGSTRVSKGVLEPNERISEVLFGLIMVLTFTGSLSVADAGRDDVRAMLIGALGCNLAWGLIDGIFYMMGSLLVFGRAAGLHIVEQVRKTPSHKGLPADAAEPSLARLARLDASSSGVVAVLDHGGRRLCIGRQGQKPSLVPGAFSAIRCRFFGEQIVLLGADGLLRTLHPDGRPLGEMRVRPGAAGLAVTRSGSVLVSYGRRGSSDHGVTLERLGPSPTVYTDPVLLDAVALSAETGGDPFY